MQKQCAALFIASIITSSVYASHTENPLDTIMNFLLPENQADLISQIVDAQRGSQEALNELQQNYSDIYNVAQAGIQFFNHIENFFPADDQETHKKIQHFKSILLNEKTTSCDINHILSILGALRGASDVQKTFEDPEDLLPAQKTKIIKDIQAMPTTAQPQIIDSDSDGELDIFDATLRLKKIQQRNTVLKLKIAQLEQDIQDIQDGDDATLEFVLALSLQES